MISPIWGLIGRISESQPAQVAGCLPWEIFQNPPWKTPTHASMALCLFTVPSPLSLWPPKSHRGCARKRLHSFSAFPSAAEDRPRAGPQKCSPGWKQPGWINLPRREVICGKAWSAPTLLSPSSPWLQPAPTAWERRICVWLGDLHSTFTHHALQQFFGESKEW